MYTNFNGKWNSFTYKRDIYSAGTRLIYNGKCFINEKEVELNNKIVTWLYIQNGKSYFTNNNIIYTCPSWEFSNKIVKIVVDTTPTPVKQEAEFYWTNDMVVKTIWYAIIMLGAIIFKDCIGIWVLATIIWYNSVFKKKK